MRPNAHLRRPKLVMEQFPRCFAPSALITAPMCRKLINGANISDRTYVLGCPNLVLPGLRSATFVTRKCSVCVTFTAS